MVRHDRLVMGANVHCPWATVENAYDLQEFLVSEGPATDCPLCWPCWHTPAGCVSWEESLLPEGEPGAKAFDRGLLRRLQREVVEHSDEAHKHRIGRLARAARRLNRWLIGRKP